MGMLLCCSIPTGKATLTIRSIDDWVETNPNPPGWGTAEYVLIFNWFDAIADCDYDGYVLEKQFEEGRLKITVDIRVEGAICLVLNASLGFGEDPIFAGIGEYHFRWVFEYDADPGDALPYWMDVYYGGVDVGLVDKSMYIKGVAEDANGVKVYVNQLGIYKTDFTGNPDFFYPDMLWPLETIRFKW